MSTATLAKTEQRTPKRAPPRDGRTDVKLGGDWLDRWLMELDQVELRTYLQLAHYYNTRTYHDTQALSRILPGKEGTKALERLERRGLLEVIRKEGQFHYHFPHRDSDGFHRAERARPSLSDALAFQERMSEELMALTGQDETPALRERAFKRYPQLREEYELYESAADESAPRWRLWMEVSRLLIREFEQRYGSLREDHGELFKEVSAKVLRHHLDVIDGVVGEILERINSLFREVHDTWVIAPEEEEFVGLPFVRRQAQRYGIGPEQVLLNTIEALGHQGKVVVSVDEAGHLASMVLPADTGLTKSEERVLFLKPEERQTTDSPRNQERVRRSRNKYANYLIDRAVQVLADFVAVGRVRGIDVWLERIVDLVNEQLSLLPMSDGRAIVQLEHVIDRFDAVRQGHRSRPASPPAPLPDAPAARNGAAAKATRSATKSATKSKPKSKAKAPPARAAKPTKKKARGKGR
ncbi:MAG: hypothetical protein M9894_13400 [Planctomycetes bacterium]|nr:hypothetical protein [Planctomycetota bacterium]